MKLIHLLCAGCLLLAAVPVAAQDPETTVEATAEVTAEPTATSEPTITPTPEPTNQFEGVSDGFVFKWSADSIFPEGIHFSIALQRPVDQLEVLRLTIRPEGATPITVNLLLDDPLAQGDDFADFAYIWEFSADSQAQVFGDVAYEWLAVDSAGAQAHVEDGLIFSDERIVWTTFVDPQAQIHLTLPLGGLSASAVRATVADVYALLATNTGSSEPLNIVLYNEDVEASNCTPNEAYELVAISPKSQVSLPCDPASADALYTASGYQLVQSTGTNLASAQTALVTDLVEEFYGPAWSGKDVPIWFTYGLTQFYHPASKQPFYGPVRNAARIDGLLPLDIIGDPETNQDELWRAQSYAMVLYIANLLGIDGMYALANNIATVESLAEAYQIATGQSIEGLIPGVQRWIFTQGANGAFNLTAYQGATPTPSTTPTRTPTGTPTLTPTATPIPSETPTPPPTRTRSPATATPSVTPRAAFNPTPTPEPSLLSALSDPGTQSGILSILLIALVIVVLLYFIQRRREDRNW